MRQIRMCWMCGKERRITMHHAIPKQFKPKNNRTIPLCDECHRVIHNNNPDRVQQELYDMLDEDHRLLKLAKYIRENRKLVRENRELRRGLKYTKKRYEKKQNEISNLYKRFGLGGIKC